MKKILLERLKIRKPRTEFQDVCLQAFCAVPATLQLEDFNVQSLEHHHMIAGFRSPLLRCLYFFKEKLCISYLCSPFIAEPLQGGSSGTTGGSADRGGTKQDHKPHDCLIQCAGYHDYDGYVNSI